MPRATEIAASEARMIERGTLGVSRSSVPLRLDRRLPRRSSLSVMMTNSPRGARVRFGDSLPSSRSGSQNTTEAPEAEAERREGGRRRTLGGRGTSRMVEREREGESRKERVSGWNQERGEGSPKADSDVAQFLSRTTRDDDSQGGRGEGRSVSWRNEAGRRRPRRHRCLTFPQTFRKEVS